LANKIHPAQERREFFRVNFAGPVKFQSYAVNRINDKISKSTVSAGKSNNISQSGILFKTDNNPPPLSSILWMNVDIRTLNICQEIEDKALVFNNGILGKVVRVEEDAQKNSAYDIGVCFLTQDTKDSEEVQNILSEIAKAN
jgi:hypothetical protein